MDKYYLIRSNDDGEVYVDVMDRETLLERLKDEGYYGPIEFMAREPGNDPSYWGERQVLLIKGKAVVPQSVSRVTEFDVE